MGELRPWHIIILVVVIFVLFGYKKLPDATRSLGRSLRILKTEIKSLHDDDEPAKTDTSAAVAPRAVEAPRPSVPQAPAAQAPVTHANSGSATTSVPDADQR